MTDADRQIIRVRAEPVLDPHSPTRMQGKEPQLAADVLALDVALTAAEAERDRIADNNKHTHANLDFCIEQRMGLEARVTVLEAALRAVDAAWPSYPQLGALLVARAALAKEDA